MGDCTTYPVPDYTKTDPYKDPYAGSTGNQRILLLNCSTPFGSRILGESIAARQVGRWCGGQWWNVTWRSIDCCRACPIGRFVTFGSILLRFHFQWQRSICSIPVFGSVFKKVFGMDMKGLPIFFGTCFDPQPPNNDLLRYCMPQNAKKVLKISPWSWRWCPTFRCNKNTGRFGPEMLGQTSNPVEDETTPICQNGGVPGLPSDSGSPQWWRKRNAEVGNRCVEGRVKKVMSPSPALQIVNSIYPFEV